MASVNRVLLSGIVSTDVFEDGAFRLLNTGSVGGKAVSTEVTVSPNGDLSQLVMEHIKQGMRIYVEGTLHTKVQNAQNGTKLYLPEIRAIKIEKMGESITMN